MKVIDLKKELDKYPNAADIEINGLQPQKITSLRRGNLVNLTLKTTPKKTKHNT